MLREILLRSPVVAPALEVVGRLGLPDWYIGAGAVAQTVWNELHGFDPRHGLKDLDVVYHDPTDLSADGEHRVEDRLAAELRHLGIEVDVTNEARVHTWYEQRFGVPLEQHASSAAAIATWPSTAASIGVRTDGDEFVVCAPFGLDDLFGLVVRPNTVLVTEAVYTAKAARWSATWPLLTVVPWPGREEADVATDAKPGTASGPGPVLPPDSRTDGMPADSA
jgi:hypothetical protein